ncbi:BspA family leucine-rich repeat surface protein [Listeria monocytogenes]|nr:BspA family leucine-rich repeat surface protein [Listeria monocytogenes]EAE7458723.1 BspA family leucine-rich repeat surface protein [Listeria monocytogenes]
MKKFSMRVALIVSVLFIAFGSANVSIAQERDTTNKLPEEVENLEEIPITDDLMQNPNVLEKSVADSDDPDLIVLSSGAYWTIYYNTVKYEYSLRMFGNVPSSKPTAWNSYLKSIKHIEIEEATLTGSFESYFSSTAFTVLESVRIEQCNLSGVTSFDSAFYSSKTLKEVIIRDNDYPTAPSLLSTKYMFVDNHNLTKVDLSGLDTSAVTTMLGMFVNCIMLEELGLSDWDTSSVNNMNSMFSNCPNLGKLELSNFDTSSVTDMRLMFQNCASLEALDVSNFDTSSVTTMDSMFLKCSSLEELDLSTFDTSSVTIMDRMFQECTALKSLYLDNFTDAPKMTDMFAVTTSLTYLFVSHNVSNFNSLENTSWYDEKNWVQFSNLSQLQTYHRNQSEPTGYRKGAFLSLTMDAMGGEFEDTEEQKVQNKVSGEYWEEVIPVKEGHYFDGWYLDQKFTNKFDFSLPAAVSTTIYAKWVENYTVVIPASISLNEATELKVEGINRGSKTLSVGLNRLATSVSENNKLTLANTADTTVQCLAPLSWDGSETNPENAILTLAPGSEITEGDAVMAIEAPENIQAGKYTGNLVFSINYE